MSWGGRTLRIARWLCKDQSTERALQVTGLNMHITKSQRPNKRDKWKPNILKLFLECNCLNLMKSDLVASCSPCRHDVSNAWWLLCQPSPLQANPAAPLEWEERQEILLLQALGANYLESHSNTTAVCEVIQCYTCETTWIPNTTCICHMCWLLQRTRLRHYSKFPEPLRSTLIDLPSFSDEGTECEDANQPVVHRDVTCIPVLKTWGKHANSVNEDCFTGSRLI